MILQGNLTGGKNDLSPQLSHSLPMLCDFVEEANVSTWAFVVIRALTRVIMVHVFGGRNPIISFIKKKKLKEKNYLCLVGRVMERDRFRG